MKIFISRKQSADSPFYRTLDEHGHHVDGQSFLEFDPLPFEPPKGTAWLFFYSKRGVRYYFDQHKVEGQKLAAIGPSTARELEARTGYKVQFIGTGEPKHIAQAFAQQLGEEKVAFIRAKRSRQSVQQLLSAKDQVIDCIVYDNRKQKQVPPQRAAILVFTSPMNAQAYFEQHPLQANQAVVAIGPTTAAALAALEIPSHIAEFPDEKALAKAVLELVESMC